MARSNVTGPSLEVEGVHIIVHNLMIFQIMITFQLMPEDLKRELESVHLYSEVRLFTVGRGYSSVPLQNLKSIVQHWAVASAGEFLSGLLNA